MDNIIYYLKGSSTFCYDLNVQGTKIGSTQNIRSRMKTYQTGYADLVPLVCYYKINKNCYEVDDDIKQTFNDLRLISLGSKGGTEFYDSELLPEKKLENYFVENKINFEKFDSKNLLNEIKNQPVTIDDLINVQTDLTKSNGCKKINKLKPSQKELEIKFDEFIKSNQKVGVVIAPTGWGKSFMMNYLSIFGYISKTKNDVLIMTKRKEILDLEFINEAKLMIKSNNLDIKIYNLINGYFDFEVFNNKSESNRIFIINTDKFIMSPKFSDYKNYSYGKIKLVMLDECHWSGADKLSEFLIWIKNNVVNKLIGFSATPIRTNNNNQMNSLKVFSNKDTNINVIYTRGYLDSINDGDRVQTKWLIIPTTDSDLVKINDSENEDNIFKADRVLNENGFKKFSEWFNQFIEVSLNKKGILWFGNKNNLKKFKNFIHENKSKYANLTNINFISTYSKSDKSDEDTSNNLELFKSYTTNSILLAIFRATEGFDDKSIDFGFNLYTTESSNPLLDQQKEGRVSRTYPNKTSGYFGFLCNQSSETYESSLVKRLGDWINYIKEFETTNKIKTTNTKKQFDNFTTDQYIELLLDSTKIKTINLDSIKNKIFNYCENFTGSINDIKGVIQKENKKRLETGLDLIDTKEKYDDYAKTKTGWILSDSIQLESQNWVELLRPDFDQWIQQFYTWGQLKEFCYKNKVATVQSFKQIAGKDKVPDYQYILSGMYNLPKLHRDINTILYVENEFEMI